MTKEELEKEAKEKFEQYKLKDEDYVEYDGEKVLMFNREYYAEDEYFRFYCNGYFAGAESREKQIQALGERCLQLQKDKGNLTDRVKELEEKLEQTEKDLADYQFNYPTIKELQKELDYQKQARSIAENAVVDLTKENAELKEELKKWKDGIALKDEEIGCIETDFNTFKSRAKEIIKELLDSCFGYNSKTVNYEVKAKAEQFLKENA